MWTGVSADVVRMWSRLLLALLLVVLVRAKKQKTLYEDLFSVDEENYGGGGSKRVTFASGQKGVKKDDLFLSDDQNDWLFGDNLPWLLVNQTYENADGYVNRTKRAGIELKKGINFWPNGVVPYIINPPDFNQEEKEQIAEAMRVYEELTCLTFVRRTNQKQWIYLHATNDGCYSYLGDARAYSPGPQPVSLQSPGCRQIGTYLHELGHAVGLVHEHQLPTRNLAVRYYGTNVDPENVDQLEIYNPRVINTFNTAYDLGSIMHYSIISFSIDDMSPTLGVDDPFIAQYIGRRYSNLLSFGDVRTINHLYKCPIAKGCSREKLASCPEPGFVDHKCKCITPTSYHAMNCKDKDGFSDYCFKLAPTGNCDIQNIDHHRYCSKTCGFCPRFKPGESAIGPLRKANSMKCIDRYHNPLMCPRWKNLCGNPWMQRNCRATCQACRSQIGDCANMDPDSICDGYARKKLCQLGTESTKEFLRARCADSCGNCGARNTDRSCRDNLPEAQCKQFAMQDMCEKNPLEMFVKCPSTCNRCYWNKGSCSNKRGEAECVKMGLANLCTHGKAQQQMRMQCPKTCDSC